MKQFNILIILVMLSCGREAITSVVPNLENLEAQSLMADKDLNSKKISYDQYLQIKSIQNSLNYGLYGKFEKNTYGQLLKQKAKYLDQNGFFPEKYINGSKINYLIDSISESENSVDLLVSLFNQNTTPIHLDEIVVVVDDIIGKQLTMFIYEIPLTVSKEKNLQLGLTIDKSELIDAFDRRNFAISVDKIRIFKTLRFKIVANQVDSNQNVEEVDLNYYQNAACILYEIIDKYDPENELKKMNSEFNTLVASEVDVRNLTCK
ncbi:hypothetical protein [Portibacter lacus]|nr:hypothetical protein [Portibacter lacus]